MEVTGIVDVSTNISEQDYFIVGFSPEEINMLTITTGISAALSLIGSGVIVGTYIGIPETRSFAFQMVFMLSLCDFMSSLAFLLALGPLSFPSHRFLPNINCFFTTSERASPKQVLTTRIPLWNHVVTRVRT